MRLLLDTNIVLDVLLNREPHASNSASVWAAVEEGRAEGFLAAHAVTTIHYLCARDGGVARANRTIAALLKVFSVAAVDGAVIEEAIASGMSDLEDAVAVFAARDSECDVIVTRDPRGFRGSPVRCISPDAILPLLRP